MALSRELMNTANTLIGMPAHGAPWNAFQRIIRTHAVIGPKNSHQLLPLSTMRANITQTVNHVGEVVSHFVGHRSRQTIGVITSKNPRIETDHPAIPPQLVHSAGSALEVKQHRHSRETAPKVFATPGDIAIDFSDDLLLQG